MTPTDTTETLTTDRPTTPRLVGAFTALVTPFTPDGSVDEQAFIRLVERQIDLGIDGLVPCGTTGESPTTTHEEDDRLIEVAIETVARRGLTGRLPVIAGTGSNNTATAVASTRRAKALGADAALVVAPYYNKPDQRMLEAHYRTVADEGDLPVVVYNVPGRTSCNVDASTLMRLAEHPRIVAVKEASANLEQIMTILRDRPTGFAVLSGDDSWTYPLLTLGGDGVISVASNEVPAEMARLCALARAGDWPGARELHERLLDLMRVNFIAPNPVPVKAALAEMGLIHDVLRQPLLPLADDQRARLRAVLAQAGLLGIDRDGGRMTDVLARGPGSDAPTLRARLEELVAEWPAGTPLPPTLAVTAATLVQDLVAALEAGTVRAAEPDPAAAGGWRANAWVKTGILLGFRIPGMRDYRDGPILAARDRVAYGVLDVLDSQGARAAKEQGAPWRVVPGGTSIRSGVHLEPGVTVMPPAYLNVGAWVGRGTMVDSHALVGSCAQIGERVHLSAAVQVGGVLEPAGARPVVVEDDAFIGGGCGLYDGVVVGRGAVLGAGVTLTGQGRLVDLVRERELVGTSEAPLVVPPGAVVVPGTRPASGQWAAERGISLAVPVIVKQRDASTDARVALEDALR